MATTQCFGSGYTYCVVTNSGSQPFPTLSDNTHIGYDTISDFVPRMKQVGKQGENAVSGGNGTIPDFINNQTAIATGTILVSLGYRNPS